MLVGMMLHTVKQAFGQFDRAGPTVPENGADLRGAQVRNPVDIFHETLQFPAARKSDGPDMARAIAKAGYEHIGFLGTKMTLDHRARKRFEGFT